MIKKIIFLSIFLILSSPLFAATIDSTSCNDNDVQTAINSSSTGDIVTIPAGECNWDNTVTISDTKKIELRGAGKTNTIITVSASTGVSMGRSGSDINSIGFIVLDGKVAISAYGNNFKIHDNNFKNGTVSNDSNYGIIVGANRNEIPTGVIYNNTSSCRFVTGNVTTTDISNYLHSQGFPFGAGQYVYIEDNIFFVEAGYTYLGNAVDTNYGMGYVFRYNTVTDMTLMVHSFQDTKLRGTLGWEIYGNTVTDTSQTLGKWGGVYLRGGTGFLFNNSIEGFYSYASLIFNNVRSSATYTGAGGGGACNGTNAFDGNTDGMYGYPCRDQIGRHKDSSLLVYGETPYPTQDLYPAYVFNNFNESDTLLRTYIVGGEYNDTHIVANRDYYDDSTGGVSMGTKANIPATCTVGQGYWVTDEADWNTEVAGADGQLYTCSVTDTWTLYYTPYTYPHPLRGPNISTNLTGPGISMNESDVVAGGKVVEITISGDTFVATAGDDNAITTATLQGLSGSAAWNTNVRDTLTHAHLVRTSDTVLTLTLPACAGYNITELDTITWTLPGSAITSGSTSIASPSIIIYSETEVGTTVGKAKMGYSADGSKAEYDANGVKIQ